jgi:hypothetical protein
MLRQSTSELYRKRI